MSRSPKISSGLEYIVLLGLGAGGVWLIYRAFGIKLPDIAMAVVLCTPLALFLIVTTFWTKPAVEPVDQVVDYAQFKRDPDCLIAPNFDEVSSSVMAWLDGYLARTAAHRVYVRVQPDEPHLSAEIYVVGTPLSAEERRFFAAQKADGIRVVAKVAGVQLDRPLDTGEKITRIVWD